MTFFSVKRPPAPQPPCPSATVLSLQPPSPICHPDRRGGTCSAPFGRPTFTASPPLSFLSLGEPVTFSIFRVFRTPNQMFFNPSTKPSSCSSLAKRLADLSHNEGFIARSRRTSAMLVGRCYSELSGHKHKKSQPPSEADLSRRTVEEPAVRLSAVPHFQSSHTSHFVILRACDFFLSAFAHPTRCFQPPPQDCHPACPGMPCERSPKRGNSVS